MTTSGQQSRDLLDAYVGGRVSRRTLIRRLVAGGIGFGAAISYAHLLAPKRAGAAGCEPYDSGDNEYPGQTLRVNQRTTQAVLDDGALSVMFDSDQPGAYTVGGVCSGNIRWHGGKLISIFDQLLTDPVEVQLDEPDTLMLDLPLSPAGAAIMGSEAGELVKIEIRSLLGQGFGGADRFEGETVRFLPDGGSRVRVTAISKHYFCERPDFGTRFSRIRKLSR